MAHLKSLAWLFAGRLRSQAELFARPDNARSPEFENE